VSARSARRLQFQSLEVPASAVGFRPRRMGTTEARSRRLPRPLGASASTCSSSARCRIAAQVAGPTDVII